MEIITANHKEELKLAEVKSESKFATEMGVLRSEADLLKDFLDNKDKVGVVVMMMMMMMMMLLMMMMMMMMMMSMVMMMMVVVMMMMVMMMMVEFIRVMKIYYLMIISYHY